MKRITAPRLLAFSVAILLASSLCVAQETTADAGTQGYLTLERLQPQRMSADDAALLKARSGEVVRAAEFFGIDLRKGSWTYQQSICPLMQKHVIVNYLREEGPGTETQFTAIVPRGQEPVRIVPIQRNGLAPFTPAETSTNSVALFNRVWSSEGGDLKTIEKESNWITLGMCYGEMVGSHPLLTARPWVERHAGPPTLRFESDGGASTIFTDIEMPSQTWNWSLQFDHHGSLIRVGREKLGQAVMQPTLAQSDTPENLQPPPSAASMPTPPTDSRTLSQNAAAQNRVTGTAPPTPPRSATKANSTTPHANGSRIMPDAEAPAGRLIPDAKDDLSGRILPGAQELPGLVPGSSRQ